MVAFIPMWFEGYDSTTQTISELSAIGAPTRSLWVLPGALYTVLVLGFGWAVWKSAGSNQALRTVGALILAFGSLGFLWPLGPMHSREVLAAGGGSASDTLHLVLGGITVILMTLAIGFGAAALGTAFRWFSIATLVVLLAFGSLTFLDAPRVEANEPTPWLGIWQRINTGAFLLWVGALATALLRASKVVPVPGHRRDLAA